MRSESQRALPRPLVTTRGTTFATTFAPTSATTSATTFALALLLPLACDHTDAPADLAALPEVPYCDAARSWPESWALTETRAFELIEDLRERGADCGEKGRAPTAPPIRWDGRLTCAARIHAIAMAEQAHVGHTTPDEVDLEQRMEAVGYGGDVIEHLAAGPHNADEAVTGVWRAGDRECINLLSAAHIDVGLGFVGDTEPGTEYETYWVLVLGNPPGRNP